MAIDGILFDLDGTLWDACVNAAASWQSTLRRLTGSDMGIDLEAIRKMMGHSLSEITAEFFPDRQDIAARLVAECVRDEAEYLKLHGGKLYPGVAELLKTASGKLPLFIVSNCSFGYIESFLDFSGLKEYIEEYLHPDLTGRSKAGNISLLAEKYSLRSPVYVGDTHMDRDAALEAKCPFIHAAYGFEPELEWADKIYSPLELLRYIQD